MGLRTLVRCNMYRNILRFWGRICCIRISWDSQNKSYIMRDIVPPTMFERNIFYHRNSYQNTRVLQHIQKCSEILGKNMLHSNILRFSRRTLLLHVVCQNTRILYGGRMCCIQIYWDSHAPRWHTQTRDTDVWGTHADVSHLDTHRWSHTCFCCCCWFGGVTSPTRTYFPAGLPVARRRTPQQWETRRLWAWGDVCVGVLQCVLQCVLRCVWRQMLLCMYSLPRVRCGKERDLCMCVCVSGYVCVWCILLYTPLHSLRTHTVEWYVYIYIYIYIYIYAHIP